MSRIFDFGATGHLNPAAKLYLLYRDTDIANATSYLLGLRYLTAADTTCIAEYYHNGTGYSDQQAQQFHQLVNAAFTQLQQSGSSLLLQKALSLSQGS